MKNSFLSLKKNLQEKIEENPNMELYFFDESRFGTHSKAGRGWFPKGIRTSVSVKLGFENFYVYSAVNVYTGDDFSFIMPNVDTECMNVFLKEMSKNLKDREVICVMDGAGWHKSKALIVPTNIKIIYLSPYSPELNPVEKLWQYMKSHIIKNKIYDNINDLEEAVCRFIRGFDAELIKKTCSTNHFLH